MQAVTYQHPDGREIAFRLSPPYVFEKIEGIHAADTDILSTTSPWHDGSQFQNLRLMDREISLSFYIEGTSRQDMYEKRLAAQAILTSLPAASGESGRLIYQNDAGQWWIPAIVKQGVTADARTRNFNHCQAVFWCPDPYWRGMEEQETDLAYTGTGLEFPLDIDSVEGVEFGEASWEAVVVNGGSAAAPLQIRIAGPATFPKITKVSTGEYIRVKTKLEEGDVLRINTTRGQANVEIGLPRGDWWKNGFGYLDLGSTLFQLDPGENRIRYESADETEVTQVKIYHYDSYEGV